MVYINEETLTMSFDMINDDGSALDGWFECDDLIAESIVLLNRKGYKTSCCCQGHISTSMYYYFTENSLVADQYISIITPYIWFEHLFQLNDVPEGWNVSIEENRTCIRYDKILDKYDIPDVFDGLTLEFYKDILYIMKDLYHWVNNLPDIKAL